MATTVGTQGGAFNPDANYNFTGDVTVSGSLTVTGTMTDTGSTLASPTITGTVAGGATYTSPVLTTATVTTSLVPTTNDGAPLGDTTHQFSDLFLAEGAVINFDNGDATITQAGDVITVAGADLKITTPGTASTSVATIDGAQTLTNKTIASSSTVPYVAGVAAGYKVARVEMALDGSNPSSWATGLATIISVTATLKGSVAPGVGTCLVTAVINGTSVDFYAWKPTATGDCTLIASTGTETFYAIAVGT